MIWKYLIILSIGIVAISISLVASAVPYDIINLRGERMAATWENDKTWVAIGTTFVDVYTITNSNGEAIRIDTGDTTKVTLQIIWTNVGTGTQTCQIVDIADSNNVLITSDALSNGVNIKADIAIPEQLLNTVKSYKPQCKSSNGLDVPSWLGGQVLLKN